jgi:hypothetical protein
VPLTIFASDRFADHLNPPGHPERVERVSGIVRAANAMRAIETYQAHRWAADAGA